MEIFGNKISNDYNHDYNRDQFICVWIISCHIIYIRFFIIFIINFSQVICPNKNIQVWS